MASILDMETAVKMAEKCIKAGESGFVIEAEFGRVAVETTPKDYIPTATIEVERWADAPGTKWAMKNRGKRFDYHVILEKGKTPFVTHVRVIQAMTRCLLLRVFDEEITNEDVIDAAVKVFMIDVDHKLPSVNVMEKEYGANILGPLVRNDFGVRDLIRDHVVRRDIDAQRVLDTGKRLSETTRNGWHPGAIMNFTEGYYRDMMYVILYVAELTDRNIDMMVHVTRTINFISTSVDEDGMYLTGTCVMAITER